MLGASLPYTIRPNVLLREAETASTDGQNFIWLPPEYLGHSLLVSGFDRIRSALLAHEISHWLQPLDEIRQVEKETGLSHEFVNIALDIQGEALIATLVPNYQRHLTATRRLTAKTMRDDYLAGIRECHQTKNFFGLVISLGLLARYVLFPSRSFLSPKACGLLIQSLGKASPFVVRDMRMDNLFKRMDLASSLRAVELPKLLRAIARDFPELCTDQAPPFKIPLGGGSETSEGLGKLLDSFQLAQPEPPPISFNEGPAVGYTPLSREEQARANAMSLHFASPQGGIEIMAPGQFDRLAALGGSPMPWTMTMQADTAQKPMPNLFVAVDISGSMGNNQRRQALSAARSITHAVQQQGGDVRGLIFNHFAWHTKAFDSRIFFAESVAGLSLSKSGGGTSFSWLPLIWQDFPNHWVVLLTDGDSGFDGIHHIPERRRKQTGAIVIPPGDANNMLTVAANVVEVTDLRLLAGAMTSVLPRRSM